MHQLILQRQQEFRQVKDLKGRTEDSTIGTITLLDPAGNQLFKGYTCENIGPSTDTPNQDKRIVARDYKLEWTKTTKNSNSKLGKYKNKALLVTCDSVLPNFRNRRILIHTGNFPTDTEGCILIGTSQNARGAVNSSVDAIIKLFDLITKIQPENIVFSVKEIS